MRTIIIENHGGNMTPAVVAALRGVTPGEPTVLRFSPSDEPYRFTREGAHVGEFYPSNNCSGTKRVIFPILGIDDLVIDGGGAEFLFCDRVFPFIIQHSHRIELRDFTINFDFPRYAQGIVTACDEAGFTLAVDGDAYPYTVEGGSVAFAAGAEVRSTAERKFFLADLTTPRVGVCYLFAGDCPDSREGLAAPHLETDAAAVAGGIRFTYCPGSQKKAFCLGDLLLVSHDENRENDNIFAEFSDSLIFRRVTMHRGAGMGIIAQLCRDITIDRLAVEPLTPDSSYSITADAIHLVNCDGRVEITNCRITQTVDDAVNIHGVYALVRGVEGDTVEIGFAHPEQQGLIPCLAGDILHVSDGETMRETGTVTVRAVDYPADRSVIRLTLDEDEAASLHVGDLLENPARMPEVTMTGCTVTACPHMRISSSGRTIIRGNTLGLSHRDIMICDLLEYWYESGAVEDVLIEENRFVRTTGTAIEIRSGRRPGAGHPHRNIRIIGNRFALPPSAAIRAADVEGLVIEGNHFAE